MNQMQMMLKNMFFLKIENVSYHNTVGFSYGPQIDLLIISTCDEDPTRLVAQGQAVDGSTMSNKLLWNKEKKHVKPLLFPGIWAH